MPKSKITTGASSTTNEQNQKQTLVSLYDVDDISPRHCGYCNQNGNVSIGLTI